MSTKNLPASAGVAKVVLEVRTVFASSGSVNTSGFDAKAQGFLNSARGLYRVRKYSAGQMMAEVTPHDKVNLEFTQNGIPGHGSFRLVCNTNETEVAIDTGSLTNIDGPGADNLIRISGKGRGSSMTWVFVCESNEPQARPTPPPIPTRPVSVPSPSSPKPLPPAPALPIPTSTAISVEKKPTDLLVGEPLAPPLNVLKIPLSAVRPNPEQPRKVFNQARMASLINTIKRDGQQTAIEVIEVFGDRNIRYEIVAGERRWRALVAMGAATVNAIVLTKDQVPNRAEQNHRCRIADHNRDGYTKEEVVLSLIQEQTMGAKIEDMAAMFGKSTSWVTSHLVLKNLHPDLMKLLNPSLPRAQQISITIARQLARVGHDNQLQIHEKVSTIASIPMRIREVKVLVEAKLSESQPKRKSKASSHKRTIRYAVNGALSSASRVADYTPEILSRVVIGMTFEDVNALITAINSTVSKIHDFADRLAKAATDAKLEARPKA